MRVVFIGCVEFSYKTIQALNKIRGVEVVGIVTRSESKFNSDFHSLDKFAQDNNIAYFTDNCNDQAVLATWIRHKSPDAIYCFGWSQLLQSEILSIPPIGVIGFHPSLLPQNRGRHPLIWAIALGLPNIASSFFFMDEGADSGDILSQTIIPIFEWENINDVYSKLTETAILQLEEFTPNLMNGTYNRIPQDGTLSNYWRKRTDDDGKIDWRMTCSSIYNLVRALTKPFPGAHFKCKNNMIRVWKVRKKENDHANIEPGKIININETSICVKCGDGAIEILECEPFPVVNIGDYL